MKNLMFLLISLSIFLVSCQSKFNKTLWIDNDNIFNKSNPRISMTDDLMNNYLKKGMHKNDVLELLGLPYKDSLSFILPKNKKIPDSLTINYSKKPSDEFKEKTIEQLNKWLSSNHVLVPLLKYPVGWSMVDPIFLEIQLNNKNEVVDFWVKEY